MFNKILVVCIGNICRSPTVEALLKSRLAERGIDVSSAGIHALVDKPLIGFWLLLACPWIVGRCPLRSFLYATALALTLSAVLALGGALLMGVIAWAPKWPDQGWLWMVNNLLLVTLVEEALFRGYIQGGLSRLMKNLPRGENLALLLASLIFGLAHAGAGWQWVVLASLAGVGYGLAYRFGGLGAAILSHFGLNLMHLALFTYPMAG